MAEDEKTMREELARIRQNEITKEAQQDEMRRLNERAMTRAASKAEAADKLAKGGVMTDPHSGREITLWEYALKKAEAALGAEVNSYNDYRSALMGLWNINSAMVHALHQSIREKIIAPIENVVTDYMLLPVHDLLEPLTDKVANLVLGSDDPEVTLPQLRHQVSFSDDNKLVIEPLTRSDNEKETGLLDRLFAKGVKMWLSDNGYKPSPGDSSTFVDQHGRALDKGTFDALKEDPDNGLATFLRGYSDLEFTPRGP